MSRNDNLIALRPVIDSIDANSSCSEAEQFQNKVLRPIIKFQHELIVVVFNAYLTKKRIDLISDTLEKKPEKLITIFKNDQFLIAELKGLIVSFFTTLEYHRYQEMKPEINKRIVQIIRARILSVLIKQTKNPA